MMLKCNVGAERVNVVLMCAPLELGKTDAINGSTSCVKGYERVYLPLYLPLYKSGRHTLSYQRGRYLGLCVNKKGETSRSVTRMTRDLFILFHDIPLFEKNVFKWSWD